MVGVRRAGRIIVAARAGKVVSGTAAALVDMKGKEARAAILRQSGYIGHDQNALWLLIKLNAAVQTGGLIAASDLCGPVRTGRTCAHTITSQPAYAGTQIAVKRYPCGKG